MEGEINNIKTSLSPLTPTGMFPPKFCKVIYNYIKIILLSAFLKLIFASFLLIE